LILFIAAFAVHNYLVSIYEVIYRVDPKALYADNKSKVTVMAIPLNGLGGKALFRKAEASYTITEGNDLVLVIKNDETNGILVLQAKDKAGTVRIKAKSRLALLPSPITVNIHPNLVEVKH
jgi:hypothetical protein